MAVDITIAIHQMTRQLTLLNDLTNHDKYITAIMMSADCRH